MYKQTSTIKLLLCQFNGYNTTPHQVKWAETISPNMTEYETKKNPPKNAL